MVEEKSRIGIAKTRCPYCHDAVEHGVEPAVCVACHALHHEACMIEHGACASCAAPHPRLNAREAVAARSEAELGAAKADLFYYEAVNGKGQRVRGTVEGPNREAAKDKVLALGLFPTKLSPTPWVCTEGGCQAEPSTSDRKRCREHSAEYWARVAGRVLVASLGVVSFGIAFAGTSDSLAGIVIGLCAATTGVLGVLTSALNLRQQNLARRDRPPKSPKAKP